MTGPAWALARALRKAAVAATRAPSIHNTQPWRFAIGASVLDIYADNDRRVPVVDPLGRQWLLSLGCALLNARASLAASGFDTKVERFPASAQPNLVARLHVDEACGTADDFLAELAPVIDARRTNRRPFTDFTVDAETLEAMRNAADLETADLFAVQRPEQRLAVARLIRTADETVQADSAYRAELRGWLSDDPGRRDGIPARSLAPGGGPVAAVGDECLLVLGSAADNPLDWLRTGEALERLLLEATRRNYATGLFTPVVEIPRTNVLLRQELGLTMHPHMVIRVGRAPETPPTRRRRLVDVIAEAS